VRQEPFDSELSPLLKRNPDGRRCLLSPHYRHERDIPCAKARRNRQIDLVKTCAGEGRKCREHARIDYVKRYRIGGRPPPEEQEPRDNVEFWVQIRNPLRMAVFLFPSPSCSTLIWRKMLVKYVASGCQIAGSRVRRLKLLPRIATRYRSAIQV